MRRADGGFSEAPIASVSAPPWFGRQHAAVIRSALEHRQGLAVDTQAISGWSEALRELVAADYLSASNKRLNGFTLTGKGRALEQHPEVVALRHNGAETKTRAEAKPKLSKTKTPRRKAVPATAQAVYDEICQLFNYPLEKIPKPLHDRCRTAAIALSNAGAGAVETRLAYNYCKGQNWERDFTPMSLVHHVLDAQNRQQESEQSALATLGIIRADADEGEL